MKIVIGLFLLAVSLIGYSQSPYEKLITQLAKDISNRIDSTTKIRLGVMPFVNSNAESNSLGSLVGDDLTAELSNFSGNQKKFQVGVLSKEKKGDSNLLAIKDAIAIARDNSLDVLVYGTIILLNDAYKLTVNLIETSTGNIISSVRSQFPRNKRYDEMYGVVRKKSILTDLSQSILAVAKSNPASENEKKSTNPNCESENTGDFCFFNEHGQDIQILIWDNGGANPGLNRADYTLTISPSTSQCLTNMNARNYYYKAINVKVGPSGWPPFSEGMFNIQKCKSGKSIIR